MTAYPTSYSQQLWEDSSLEPAREIPLTIAAECSVDRVEHEMTHIDCGDRSFELRQALSLVLVSEDGRWFCEYEALGLLGYGDSPHEALRVLQEDFLATYDGLINEPDEALTLGARELRDTLEELVTVRSRVTPSGLTLRSSME